MRSQSPRPPHDRYPPRIAQIGIRPYPDALPLWGPKSTGPQNRSEFFPDLLWLSHSGMLSAGSTDPETVEGYAVVNSSCFFRPSTCPCRHDINILQFVLLQHPNDMQHHLIHRYRNAITFPQSNHLASKNIHFRPAPRQNILQHGRLAHR